MKTIKSRGTKGHAGYDTERECLLRHPNFVSDLESASFEPGQIAWEASTLPLSYTRQPRLVRLGFRLQRTVKVHKS